MATSSDPYRELELYLEKAQEEIGKAFDELLQHETKYAFKLWNDTETVVPPPPAFRSPSGHTLCCNSFGKRAKVNSASTDMMNRVCYDGTVLDLQKSSAAKYNAGQSPYLLQKSLSCTATFSEETVTRVTNSHYESSKNHDFSQCHKQTPKPFQSSASFPEGSMDVLLREKVLCTTTNQCSYTLNGHRTSNTKDKNDLKTHMVSKYFDPQNSPKNNFHHLRQRSYSESAPEHINNLNEEKYFHTFPRPPSGDVNLLSIWADNLVLEIDKSMSGELNDSISSYSPISDYSLSLVKIEDDAISLNISQNNHVDNYSIRPDNVRDQTENISLLQRDSYRPVGMSNHFKSMSPSPDSGIGPISYDALDGERHIPNTHFDHMVASKKMNGLPETISVDVIESITPPPPGFEDKQPEIEVNHSRAFESCSNSNDVNQKIVHKKDAETQVRKQVLKVATCVTLSNDSMTEEETTTKEMHRHARVVPIMTMELEDCATLSAACTVNEAPWKGSAFYGIEDPTVSRRSQASTSSIPSDSYLSVSEANIDDVFEDAQTFQPKPVYDISLTKDSTNFSTLPKQTNSIKDVDRYSCSLPRDAGRVLPENKISDEPPQRSASSSAVSSVSQVSMEELAAFMRKVKTSTYHPPPRADVSVNVKGAEDDEIYGEECNRDAITQTTPIVPLSRSSSFTWVTECDCSDWDSSNPRSGSEDSLLVFSCTNTTASEKKVPQSSSSSISTNEDGFDAPQNSGCSSLYLSACSEASDSHTTSESSIHEKIIDTSTVTTTGPERHLELSLNSFSAENSFSAIDHKLLPSAGILTDIAEEDVGIIETISRNTVNVNTVDTIIGPSSSFPLTAKPGENTYRGQPIEAKVLIVNDLNAKSWSVPLLRPKKHTSVRKPLLTSNESSSNKKSKAQNESNEEDSKEDKDNKLQAIEACRWLRAAGFPQYAQMYEDNLFPIDISTVQRDHSFLHPDSLQSLFRRINTLNRCAKMKFVDSMPRRPSNLDESDDEEQCALSENWQFQRASCRWSRVPSPTQDNGDCNACSQDRPVSPKPSRQPTPTRKFLTPEEPCSSSHDSVFAEDQHSSPDSLRRSTLRHEDQYLPLRGLQNSPGSSSGSGGTLSEDPLDKDLRRSGSDRIREGAMAILRRVESLKGKRKKKVGGTVKTDKSKNHSPSSQRTNGAEGCSYGSSIPSPLINRSCKFQVISPQDPSDGSQESTPQMKHRKKGSLNKNERDTSAYSDSECPIFLVSESWTDANYNDTKPHENHRSSRHTLKVPSIFTMGQGNSRDRSSGRSSSSKEKEKPKKKCTNSSCKEHHNLEKSPDNRASHYDNFPAPLAVFNSACVDSIDKDPQDAGKAKKSPPDRCNDHGCSDNNDGEIIIINSERRDSGVGASLTRRSTQQLHAPWHSFPSHLPLAGKSSHRVIPIANLSAPQVLVLRKLSLLKLTALMEKFSPSSRTGWSWAMPKFIRRIRTPDYRDKLVFGVPLLLTLQRTGQPLPNSIVAAIHFLRSTALASTGLFRKSGVRSRIQKLRTLNETNPELVRYEDQQAYDVADMLKQYFRELPEALLTNKLSETFISIFQCIPQDLRLEAIQCAILLMPDENREVLQALLSFLREVCEHSDENQMTATNIAVCFAPSLFHLSSPRSGSLRRRKTIGTPDFRELNENKAAYECLATMVLNFPKLCSVTEDDFSQSRLSGIDDYEPVALEELSSLVHKDYHGWRAYVEACIHTLLKEAKDKYKGWVNVCQIDNVDLAYKKVCDGHPLRLWKVSTEIEAPPVELLNRILRERHLWDDTYIKWKVLQTLDKNTEVFQFACTSIPPHPPCDYCIIRSWKTDLPKGACVLIEASVDHGKTPVLVESVKGVVLASRYLIEPCGSGKSRVTHISRVDTKGRSPEWYHRAYGHIATLNFIKLKDSFSHIRTEGPETKV